MGGIVSIINFSMEDSATAVDGLVWVFGFSRWRRAVDRKGETETKNLVLQLHAMMAGTNRGDGPMNVLGELLRPKFDPRAY